MTASSSTASAKKAKGHQWGEDRLIECAGGIHFYLTREEAEAHA